MWDWVKFIWDLKHKGIGAEEVYLYASVVVDTIWRTRNDKVHNNYIVNVKNCIDYICSSYANLHATIFPSPSACSKVSWSPPPQDWIKLNCDVKVGLDSMCSTLVVRNHLGRVVWVQTSRVDFSDALCGEVAACCLAISTAKDIGAKFVIVESNSREHEFAKKFPFARDRIVELYFWILGVYYEPKYSQARKLLTKVIALTSITDDIYDAYGTIDELQLLTQAMQRWDISYIDKLEPEYLKTYYKAMLDSYEEFEKELKKKEIYKLEYAKEEMKRMIRAYFEEARWLNQKYFPSLDEHLRVSYVTNCGNIMLIATSFVGMDNDIVTNQTLQWLSNDPKIVKASTLLSRHMNDIASRKFEQERNHIPSTVECYMKQYGVSEEEAVEELNKRVVNYWKEINEDFIRPTAVPFPILIRVLNFTKVAELIYKEDNENVYFKGMVIRA
uniref:Terpene synthase metal-binding domain-containing protein n=1 Tax=Cannabis sativa TaxID=3483 RepID=A0A803QA38_CANSA